jgi:hypothetical protein
VVDSRPHVASPTRTAPTHDPGATRSQRAATVWPQGPGLFLLIVMVGHASPFAAAHAGISETAPSLKPIVCTPARSANSRESRRKRPAPAGMARPRPPSAVSFDHLVAAHNEGLRHGEAERLASLEIDHQLEFSAVRPDRCAGPPPAPEARSPPTFCLAPCGGQRSERRAAPPCPAGIERGAHRRSRSWLSEQRAKLSRGNDIDRAMDYPHQRGCTPEGEPSSMLVRPLQTTPKQ